MDRMPEPGDPVLDSFAALREDALEELRSSLHFESSRRSHELAFCRRHSGMRLRSGEIEHVHNRAPDMFLPGKHYEAIANIDDLLKPSLASISAAPTRSSTETFFACKKLLEGSKIPSSVTSIASI
jgi:hypothetical protein